MPLSAPAAGSAAPSFATATPPQREPVLAVRIVSTDHYLDKPDARFQGDAVHAEFSPPGTPLRCVPVLRVYGLTPQGQKCLVHVHNVFPYFFVPYEGPEPLKRKPNGAVDEPEDDEDDALTDECRLYVYRLGASIDRALSTFLNRDPTDPIKSQHVRAIRLVKGIPFYGFHSSYAFFLKVYFLDPSSATKAEKLMQQGAVMGRTFDIYESHFPYGLQFMLDHNLYGMDLMNLANLRFRQPGVLNIEVARDRSAFLNNSSRLVKKYSWSHDSSPTRQSEMDLELDVWASDICNRDAVPERPEEALIDFSQRKDRVPSRKHVPSVDAIWEDERERRRRAGKDPTEVDAGVEKENHVPRDPEPPGPAEGQPRQMRWGGEKELWDEIDDQLSTAFAARESGSEAKVRKALENLFPKLDDLDGGIVQTLWQAVELLWPSSLPWREEEHVVSAPATPRRLDSRGSLLQTPAVSVRRGRPSMTPWEAAERLRPGLTQGFRGGMSTPLGSEGPGGEIGDEIVVDEQLISEIAAKAAATPRTKPNAKLISSPFAGTPINLAARQTVPTPDRAVREDLLDALVDIPEELERDLERAQTQEPDESDENPDEEILVHDDLVEENYGGFELQGAHDEEEDEYQDVGWDGAADETEFLEDNFGEVFAYASSGIAKPGDPEAPEDSPKAGSSRKRTFAQYDGPAFDDFNDFDSPRQSRKSLSSVGKRNRTTLVRAKDREPVLHSPVNAAPNDLLMWSSSPSSQGDGLPSQEIFGSPPRFVSPEPERSKTVVMDDVTETFETRVPTEAPPGQTPCVEEAHSSPLSALFVPKILPPKPTDLLNTLQAHRTPEVVHRKPFYSDPKDVPHRSRNVAGKDFRIFGDGLDTLQPFGATFGSFNLVGRDHQPDDRFLQTNIAGETVWTPLALPPNYKSVAAWLGKNEGIKSHVVADGGEELAEIFQPRVEEAAEGLISLPPRRDPSQLEGPTPDGIYGFKFNENKTDSITHTQQYVTLLSVECHVTTRDQLRPDPAHDPVEVIFYCFQTQDHARFPSNGNRKGYFTGMIRVDRNAKLRHMGLARDVVEDLVATEEDLFRRFKDLVLDFDPEILVGYELQSESWGYLLERAAKAYEIDLCVELSRVRDKAGRTRYARDDDDWGYKKASSVHIDGRIVLNVWRLLRAELNLTSYNLENVVYHILHHRIPHFSFSKLTEWYNGSHLFKGRTLEYYLDRVQKNLELLDDTDLIGRTSEFARVFGVEFYSVISRGSQFKVESVMARIAKPRNFALFSPSRKQVANQRAAEALPLILEPESAFYPDPVVVLDFQSLYPSVMIAYNYCYSTCLGRTASVGKPHQLGAQLIEIAPEVVEALKDHINVSPNGLIFVKPHIREGILRKMLTALLDTRVMVKQSMKLHKLDRALSRLLDARQLGLKYLANVTYGYTSASFSGRMPCVEIADAIVQTGRETLEHAIQTINKTEEWDARVVYGDTDSVFIHLEGCSFERAFKIGREIVDSVTRVNPYPVKLKFEKVYHPCVLQAKKRYVGAMYETPDQPTFGFDAKGIETVRRDGCPAVAKTLEKCLRMLFTSADLSPIKAYVQRQFRKILEGRVSIQDLMIAKEVKMGNYSEKGIPPPGAWLSAKLMEEDPRAEPQYGQRVPYCVAHTGPSSRLIDCVVSPRELVQNRAIHMHGIYYVTKQIIPALKRVFDLMGADVQAWYDEIPKLAKSKRFIEPQGTQASGAVRRPGAPKQRRTATIEQYYASKHCLICGELTNTPFCADCESHPQTAAMVAYEEASHNARTHYQLVQVCRSCTGHRGDAKGPEIACDSLDCPIYYARESAKHKLRHGNFLISQAQGLKPLDW